MRSRQVWPNLLVTIFGLILACVLLEGVVRLFELSKTLRSYQNSETLRYRQIIRWLSDDAAYPYDLAPGREVVVKGNRFRINHEGLRDREFARNKPTGVLRIACLGDSVTFGQDNPEEFTYPRLLEKELTRAGHRVEVMNFGVLGYDLSSNIEHYYRKALPFQPDVVILQFGLNDVAKHERPLLGPLAQGVKTAYVGDWSPKTLLRRSALYLFLAERYNFVAGKLGFERPIMKDYAIGREEWSGAERRLVDFAADLRSRNVRLVLAFFPYDFQIYSPRAEVLEPQRMLREFAFRSHIEFVDLTDALRQADSQLGDVFLDDVHLNQRGTKVAALSIREALSNLPVSSP